jgi:hypothetical protein
MICRFAKEICDGLGDIFAVLKILRQKQQAKLEGECPGPAAYIAGFSSNNLYVFINLRKEYYQ